MPRRGAARGHFRKIWVRGDTPVYTSRLYRHVRRQAVVSGGEPRRNRHATDYSISGWPTARKLFCSWHNAGGARFQRGEKFLADFLKQGVRQLSICDTRGVAGPRWPKIGSRPGETIGLGEHDPRSSVVEAETAFRGGGDFDGKPGIGRGRVSDRQYRHRRAVRVVCGREDDGARSCP